MAAQSNTQLLKPSKIKPIAKLIIAWQEQYGRHTLPWQQQQTPYRVWISEIMLQQTQVDTVIPYFQRFMKHFPTVKQLANAEQDQVLSLWTGLGYYARARNLHKAAQIIDQQFSGHLPSDLPGLIALPGIGPSTAGAILSLGFNKPATILDGNVKRVLTRFLAFEGWPGNGKIHQQLWQLADQLTPKKDCHTYNQGLMDLGAMICTRSKPSCDICPLHKNCLAHQQKIETQFPHSKPNKTLKPTKQCQLLIVQNQDGHVLLEKRPDKGIWGGLWSFPQCKAVEKPKSYLKNNYGLTTKKSQTLETFVHTFTHYHLQITPVILTATTNPTTAAQTRWHDPTTAFKGGLPKPVVNLLTDFATQNTFRT